MGPFRLASAEDKNICVTLFVKQGCISLKQTLSVHLTNTMQNPNKSWYMLQE